ncbi:MAG: DNA-deoxyinosine glycosylase [Clostridia bacterium]|nr:DNA-deoxyinosine glycosylase [Clostridia bacterium]
MTVIHPIPPLYNQDSRILILGSFPSVKSRESMFFYGHKQNRFWKVIAQILECDVPQDIPEKKNMLLSNKIAVWDVIGSCVISGSADSTITDAIPNDISPILNTADIKAIFTNGKKAHELYEKHIRQKVGIASMYLPSTSPANASFSFERLVSEWSLIKKFL